MKKAIVLTDHFGSGGAERVASLLVNGLAALPGMDTHVCVFEDINNYGMRMEKVHYHLLTPSATASYPRRIIARIRNLAKVIKQVRPDVIYSFGPIMAIYVHLAVKLSRVKGIRVVDSERNDPRREPVSDLKKRVRDYCYKRADVLVCQTPMAVELLRERGVDTRFVIIPNPVTPGLPCWEGAASKAIITASRLTEQKNLPLLIRAFKRVHASHPDVRLVIYGEGELRRQLEDYVREQGLQECVSLPGFARDVHSVMKKARMYVSSSDFEGISNSMLEALGIGLPTVCTDCPVGGAAMYMRHEVSGLLVPVGAEEQLAAAMCRFIEEPALAASCSEASRRINDELTLESITSRWCDLINP